MSEHNWFEVVIVNSYPVLVVVGLLILCSCLCGCWQSCERSLGAMCSCCTTCFTSATKSVSRDARAGGGATGAASAASAASVAPARGRSGGGGEREGGECAALVSCITCCNCCGVCGPPRGVQMAQPVAAADESGDGKVARAVKAVAVANASDGKPSDDDAGNPYGPNVDQLAQSAHVPLLALDQCMIRV